MESYIKYSFEGDVITINMEGSTLDQVLTKASEMYAFNDCTDIEVLEVVHNGEKYDYCGWEPSMTFSFRDTKGKIVWTESFPEWDH